jgi:hypothetical protein
MMIAFQYCGPDRLRQKDKHFRNADPLPGAVACPFGPLKDQTVLLSDPHLVLEPDLDHHPEDQSLRSFAAPRIKS